MEITRRSVLGDALRNREALVRRFSAGGRGLWAERGREEEFDRYVEECRILRELIQALEHEPVRAAIAKFLGQEETEKPGVQMMDWQLRVLRGERQTDLFRPEAGTDDRMIPPEARSVAEKVGGEIVLWNPVAGQLRTYENRRKKG